MAAFICLFFLFLPGRGETHEPADRPQQEKTWILPILQYDFISLGSQNIHSAGAGVAAVNSGMTLAGTYTRHSPGKPLLHDYPDVFHTVEALFDIKKEKKNLIILLKSESDKPLYGGLKTFQAAAVLGHEFIKTESFSLIFGGGIAVSDFGIEMEDGSTLPVIPVPLLRIRHNSRWIEAGVDFITGPNINVTIAPENRVRLKGEARIDRLRDARDLIFECSAVYRFFANDHELGDFAGIEAGIRGDSSGEFNIGGTDESFELQYYSLFAALDLSLLEISGGYAFAGRELYRGEHAADRGSGWFLSLQGRYLL